MRSEREARAAETIFQGLLDNPERQTPEFKDLYDTWRNAREAYDAYGFRNRTLEAAYLKAQDNLADYCSRPNIQAQFFEEETAVVTEQNSEPSASNNNAILFPSFGQLLKGAVFLGAVVPASGQFIPHQKKSASNGKEVKNLKPFLTLTQTPKGETQETSKTKFLVQGKVKIYLNPTGNIVIENKGNSRPNFFHREKLESDLVYFLNSYRSEMLSDRGFSAVIQNTYNENSPEAIVLNQRISELNVFINKGDLAGIDQYFKKFPTLMDDLYLAALGGQHKSNCKPPRGSSNARGHLFYCVSLTANATRS